MTMDIGLPLMNRQAVGDFGCLKGFKKMMGQTTGYQEHSQTEDDMMSILGRGANEHDQNDTNFDELSETKDLPASETPFATRERLTPQAKLGKTILIRGELTGEEDLTIEGRVEGQINLKNHNLVVGEGGNISAEVFAKSVTIVGRMEGDLNAEEKVEIQASGSLVGDIRSPRVVIADGAKFKGCVDMNVEALSPGTKKAANFEVTKENGKIAAKQLEPPVAANALAAEQLK
jgi:cytoskeletal protein CcmA (bactofilin family)